MKKALMVSSVASMIEQFNQDNITLLQQLNYEVHVATNFETPGTISKEKSEKLKTNLNKKNVFCYQIDFSRNIFNIISIIKVYRELTMVKNKENYDIVHCHSPIGGVITRLVFRKSETKVIYTAHGFQFFKGGPFKDWVLFYPIEKFLSKYTDCLLTINKVDYNIANKKFKQKFLFKIPGVGIKKPKHYDLEDRNRIREKLNIPNDAFLLCSVGELSKRKNHKVIIEALSQIKNEKIYYVICGRGTEHKKLMEIIELKKMKDRVFLLGYVENIQELFYASDISLFPSKREGLGLAGLEALSIGTPLISSNVQGIPDYSLDGVTGYVCINNSADEYKKYIELLIDDADMRELMGKNGMEIAKNYYQEEVNKIMLEIYSRFNE